MTDVQGVNKQRVTILGSTGSIGVSTLDVMARHPDRFEVFALSAATQVEKMLAQCQLFAPAFAVMASQAGVVDTAPLRKSFHYLGGLTEATETLAAFAAMCWWPQHFAAIAYGFAVLCALTIAVRIHAGYVSLGSTKDKT